MASPWQFIPEPDLIPYRAFDHLPREGLLVLAPHPDDEVFGCGGTIAKALDQGCPVTIVVASDGGQGGDAPTREAESCAAAAALAAGQPGLNLQFWRLPDRGLVPDDPLVTRICSLARSCRPGWMLTPSPFEVHPDHRALCLAGIEAAALLDCTLGFYEIGQPLMPDHLIDISAVMARKRSAMACFASQLAEQRYDTQVEGLNQQRSYTLGPAVTHAEAFWFPAAPYGAASVLEQLTARLAQRLSLQPPA